MSARAAGADMRGFRSPLAAVERKLDHERDRARADLAALAREVLGLEEIRRELAQERDAQLHCAATLLAGAMDPSAYGRCLGYLCGMERRLRERCAEAELLEMRVAAARCACVEADRRLACLRVLRESSQAAYALEQSRRDARQADLAWLARLGALRARPPKREGAWP